MLRGRILSLKQDPSHLYYRSYRNPSKPPLPTPPASHPPSREDSTTGGNNKSQDGHAEEKNGDTNDTHDDTLRIIKHYFNVSSNLTNLYSQWSQQDPNFRKKAPRFTGIRILRQDAWEALVSFICSSNNNISRISQMVEKLCVNYGPFIGTVDGRPYHDFPSPEALTGDSVESHLRSLGFGYRAKYIYQTALIVAKERQDGWLDSLCNPECPAFGVEATKGEDMKVEGRRGYRDAHEKLLELQGVGPKVADCVCLMGLGWGEAVPVDTHGELVLLILLIRFCLAILTAFHVRTYHTSSFTYTHAVWQIAQRDYKFNKSNNHKTLNKATYDAVGNHFRKLWGKEAGWAHSVLFTADLRSFSDRLTTTKETKSISTTTKGDMNVIKKEKEEEGGETETGQKTIQDHTETVTTRAVKREGTSEDETKVDAGRSKHTSVQSPSSSAVPRRVSKRLRKM